MTGHQGGAPLRFATFLAPNMVPVYRFLAERIGERLGCPVELVVGSSFDQFEQGHDPRQTAGSGLRRSGSAVVATIRKQRPGSGAKASA
jgi:hypothetical protein